MKKIDIILLIVMFMFLYGCKPKEKLTISFETIGDGAFFRCGALEEIILSDTLKKLMIMLLHITKN